MFGLGITVFECFRFVQVTLEFVLSWVRDNDLCLVCSLGFESLRLGWIAAMWSISVDDT